MQPSANRSIGFAAAPQAMPAISSGMLGSSRRVAMQDALARRGAFAGRLRKPYIRGFESAEARLERAALADLRDIQTNLLRVAGHIEEEVRIGRLGVELPDGRRRA